MGLYGAYGFRLPVLCLQTIFYLKRFTIAQWMRIEIFSVIRIVVSEV